MAEKPVYSTATGPTKKASQPKAEFKASASGPLKLRLETKGRGGKAVTVLFNLPFTSEDEAKQALKELQSSLGCGGTWKDGQMELRGDVRTRVEAWAEKKGIKTLRAGG